MLVETIKAGLEDSVAYLLEKGLDPNKGTTNFNSPLIIAINSKNKRICNILLKNKADPNLNIRFWNSNDDFIINRTKIPMEHVISLRNKELYELFLEHDCKLKQESYKIELKNDTNEMINELNFFKFVLSKCPEEDKKYVINELNTVMGFAVKSRNKEVCELLFEMGGKLTPENCKFEIKSDIKELMSDLSFFESLLSKCSQEEKDDVLRENNMIMQVNLAFLKESVKNLSEMGEFFTDAQAIV